MQRVVTLQGAMTPAKAVKRIITHITLSAWQAQDEYFGFGFLTTKFLFKECGFQPGVRHQCDHLAAAADNICQLLVSTDFAVSDIKEIRFAHDFPQNVPRFDMRRIIVPIARIRFIVDRHGAISGDRQIAA